MITVDNLNDLMEFDHVIQVHSDGTVSEPRDIYAPDVYVDLDSDGQMMGSDSREGVEVLSIPVDWDFMHGYTGQHMSSSRSFIMHESEFIGGRMSRDILATPGFYVAVVVDGLMPEESDDDTIVGWAVAYRESHENQH